MWIPGPRWYGRGPIHLRRSSLAAGAFFLAFFLAFLGDVGGAATSMHLWEYPR
jgi:hypothetical protein